MKKDSNDEQLLDEYTEVTVSELIEVSGLSLPEIRDLVEFGVLQPSPQQPEQAWHFSKRSVYIARRANRLRKDFELNNAGMALALIYLSHIEELEKRLCDLQCQLPTAS